MSKTAMWVVGGALFVGACVALSGMWARDFMVRAANVGTALGPLGTIATAAALLVGFRALALQRDALAAQREDLALQREELKLQRQEMKESTAQLAKAAEAQEDLARAQRFLARATLEGALATTQVSIRSAHKLIGSELEKMATPGLVRSLETLTRLVEEQRQIENEERRGDPNYVP